MAKIFSRILDYIGFEEEDYEEEPLEATEDFSYGTESKREGNSFSGSRVSKKEKVINMYPQKQEANLIIYQPSSCDDSRNMIDSIRSKKPVIANFESIDHEQAQRVLDMLSGAMYALGGAVNKVSNSIYVFSPDNIDVTGNIPENIKTNSIFGNFSRASRR